ncbi:7920_t:CDS:2 [Diversispora eburnea]|uniref:Glycine cleavage system H protein n=1 Tax=Diversispora eburnea TaxID=1213867 RepID=A0A9N9FXT4_9GLOM|nr:7920_t:CDS:2 [Diversispora eburnea]
MSLFHTISSKLVSSSLLVPNYKSVITRFGTPLLIINDNNDGFLNFLGKLYTKEHEWIVVKDNSGTVGITEYAQKALGDVVYVEVRDVGTIVEKSGLCGAIESVKAANDIYAPVSGEIIDVNKRLEKEPGLINESPEDEGWLCKIELSKTSELEDLLDEKAYKAHCEKSQ